MKNIYQKLALVTVGSALSFAGIETTPAVAAIVSRNFTVSDFVGPAIPQQGPLSPGNSYTGSFSYDDSLLTGVGAESISISQLTFNFLGNTYTASDDIDYPEFPKVRFLNGNLLDLNYAVTNPGNVAFAISKDSTGDMTLGLSPSAKAIRLGGTAFVPLISYYGKVVYGPAIPTSVPSSVPEPSAVVGLAVLGLGGLLLKKKATSSSQTVNRSSLRA